MFAPSARGDEYGGDEYGGGQIGVAPCPKGAITSGTVSIREAVVLPPGGGSWSHVVEWQ
jgi:hypothetical protein